MNSGQLLTGIREAYPVSVSSSDDDDVSCRPRFCLFLEAMIYVNMFCIPTPRPPRSSNKGNVISADHQQNGIKAMGMLYSRKYRHRKQIELKR